MIITLCTFKVLFAFMVGMTNLYRYYGTHILNQKRAASETFKGLVLCLLVLVATVYLLDFNFEVKVTWLRGGVECKLQRHSEAICAKANANVILVANKVYYFVPWDFFQNEWFHGISFDASDCWRPSTPFSSQYLAL